jgi:hypothetical protein
MVEKRKFTRVNIKSVAEIILPGDEFSQGYVGGISRGGLEVYTEMQMRRDAVYAFRLHFLFQDQEITETVQGKVKWSAAFKKAYVSGIEFTTALNTTDHANLLLFIGKAEAYYK